MSKALQCQSPKMIPFTPFEVYKEKYKDLFLLERTESGVVTAKFHTNGDTAEWDYPLHRGMHQLCHDIGQDADTEVLIIGGTGESFLKSASQTSIDDSKFDTKRWCYYEHSYYDGCNMCEALVNDVEQPTIGVINGPAFHSEMALYCDLTLMAEEAVIFDPHYCLGGIPGDGIQIALRDTMGRKRSNYAMMFNQVITPQMALDIGMVNEVVPRDKIYERALELGEILAAKPRITRRVTTQIMRLPLKEQMAKELRMTFGTEMWDMMAVMGDNMNHDEAGEQITAEMKEKHGYNV